MILSFIFLTNDMKTFIAISDLHGFLPEISEPADIMLIAGDVIPLNIQRDDEKSKEWFKSVFLPWTSSLPVKHVVMVAGNHDFWMEREPGEVRELCLGTKVEYLENEFKLYILPGLDIYAIYGTPLCKSFGKWAFMKSLEEQRKIFDEVRGDTKEVLMKDNELPTLNTILLSHDAPYGCSDVIQDRECGWWTSDHLGNPELRSLVEDMKPDIHIHGHIHSANHEVEKIGDTCCFNVSVLGEDYTQKYKPLYFML